MEQFVQLIFSRFNVGKVILDGAIYLNGSIVSQEDNGDINTYVSTHTKSFKHMDFTINRSGEAADNSTDE